MIDPEEGPIVQHAPLSGDPARIAQLPDALRADVIASTPATVRELPAGIRDPSAALGEGGGAESRVRVFGLDAVRGLCLLAMNFTFALPDRLILPAWMYHMQYPPPTGDYVARPGLTWQDIIFPGFLFAMAAAIPIRGSQLIAAGEPFPAIVWGSLKRTALLYVFALLIAHVNPFYTKLYNQQGNILAILGFLTCFALFIRRRSDWNATAFAWVRRAGWVAAALLLFVVPRLWGASFSPMRRDTIITSIAFVYFLGSVIWLATRGRPLARLAVMVAVVLMEVLAPAVGPIGAFWNNTSLPWIYEPWFVELLLIALPGTIAGDLLVQWTRLQPEHRSSVTERGDSARLSMVVALCLATPFVLLFGLYQRLLTATTIGVFAIVVAGALLLLRGKSERDRILIRIGGLAGALLVIGILVEPLEGGIKKDPQTMSFLFLCAGLWVGVLLACTILVDVIGGRIRKAAHPIILAGQNAMLAYVVFMLFLLHIAYLAGVGDALSATAGEQVARATAATVLVMAILWAATRNRIVWRS